MDNLSNPLNLLATNMCSPMVIYVVFVVVTGIALFMTRSALKDTILKKWKLFSIST